MALTPDSESISTGRSCNRGGRIWWMRSVEPATEARKAEGASWTALLIPTPPDHTGSDA